MARFIVCYKATSSIVVYADTAEQAQEIFECWPDADLMEELSNASIEMTEIYEEDE